LAAATARGKARARWPPAREVFMRPAARRSVGIALLAALVVTSLAALAAAPRSASAAGTWSVAHTTADDRYMGVDFIDLLHGWAAYGTNDTDTHTHAIVTTTNGGSAWSPVVLTPHTSYPDLQDIAFFNASVGLAVGRGTTVLRTTDAGATWQSVAAANTATLHGDFYDVDVVSSTRAFAAGYTYAKKCDVVMTTDAGATWVDRTPSQLKTVDDIELRGLDFVDAQRGWAAYQNHGDELRVLKTTDGGLTWSDKLLTDNMWAHPFDVHFFDALNGWLVAGYYTNLIYRTTDGGVTWALTGAPADSGQLWTAFFVSPTHGYLGTDDNSANDTILWETIDGGATWTAAYNGPTGWTSGVHALDFTDANHGWAGGYLFQQAAVLKYVGTDPLPPDTTAPVSSVTGATNGAWYRRDVVLTFDASDGGFGSSGASGITWYVDLFTYGFLLPGGQAYFFAPTDHSKDGSYQVFYYAEDNANNRENTPDTDKSITFGIDTRKPTTSAPNAASARRGTTATLKYKVKDTAPCGPKAKTVTIKIYKSGVLKKTLKYTNKAVTTLQSAKFTVPGTWKIGTYVFKVYATDNAGNAQAAVGSNKLVVK
jgi:photosystem II stability/assembly factor-like uncharacterized protein